MKYSFQEERLEEVLIETDSTEEKHLIVFNDDFNTFEHVIETLIRICKHTQEQAEQCTYIIHFKGKCCVKSGIYEKLKPMKDGIVDAGISASIH